MIHDELGRAWVLGDEGPEGVETRSPLDFLFSEEDRQTMSEDESLARERVQIGLEAIRAFHTWVCHEGAHPRKIAIRLVKASQHYAPGLVCHLSRLDATVVNGAPEKSHAAIMRVLLENPRAGDRLVAEHSARVAAVLGKAHRSEGHAWEIRAGTRLEVLTVEDELVGYGEGDMRREILRRWLRPLWMLGSLGEALKVFYAYTRSFWPELILNMSGEEISTFFVQTRAAESERVHRLVNRPVERHTGRHTTLRFQKSTAACGVYSRVQQGNHHRADSVKRAA